jgi:hypothetical protein
VRADQLTAYFIRRRDNGCDLVRIEGQRYEELVAADLTFDQAETLYFEKLEELRTRQGELEL